MDRNRKHNRSMSMGIKRKYTGTLWTGRPTEWAKSLLPNSKYTFLLKLGNDMWHDVTSSRRQLCSEWERDICVQIETIKRCAAFRSLIMCPDKERIWQLLSQEEGGTSLWGVIWLTITADSALLWQHQGTASSHTHSHTPQHDAGSFNRPDENTQACRL